MKTVYVSVPPGGRLLRACASFGLAVERGRPARPPEHLPSPRSAERSLRAGRILLLSGPSGCGKSTLARQIASAARARGGRVISVMPRRRSDATLLDCLGVGVCRGLGVLARAGLADAAVLARTPSELSEGELWRFELARAMLRVGGAASGKPAPLLLADEWCSVLDRATARSVSVSLARWVRGGAGVRVVCATAHDDVRFWLRPDAVIEL